MKMRLNKSLFIDIYFKYEDIILYIFFGVCTTIVNFISYCVLEEVNIFPKEMNTVLNTWIAWFISVVFAYITNRKWVFKSKVRDIKSILKEMLSFFTCRFLTGLLDVIIMFVFVDNLEFNNKLTKLVSNIFIIIINYIGSKFLIFNKKE